LKAGGICVPLNPTHPPSRLKDVMQDLGVQIVVCSPSLADRAGEGMKTIVVVGQSLVGQLPIIPGIPCPEVRPENAAFLVFTSGSTGKPKGIIQEHVAMATSLRDHCAAMLMSSESRTLQFSAYTFDTSISDTFGTLMRGGCVCLPSDHDRLNNLASAINSLRANLACLTPAVVDQLQPEDVPTLKALSVGGEPLTEDIVKRWADKVDLINIYGVTECVSYYVHRGSVVLTLRLTL
jgi:non-ribosomal peptide synthetase component F